MTLGHIDLIPLANVPSHLPRRASGKKFSTATIYRWTSVGVRGRRLRTLLVGGTQFVDPGDLAAFIHGTASPHTPSPRDRTREVDAATASLRTKGFL